MILSLIQKTQGYNAKITIFLAHSLTISSLVLLLLCLLLIQLPRGNIYM